MRHGTMKTSVLSVLEIAEICAVVSWVSLILFSAATLQFGSEAMKALFQDASATPIQLFGERGLWNWFIVPTFWTPPLFLFVFLIMLLGRREGYSALVFMTSTAFFTLKKIFPDRLVVTWASLVRLVFYLLYAFILFSAATVFIVGITSIFRDVFDNSYVVFFFIIPFLLIIPGVFLFYQIKSCIKKTPLLPDIILEKLRKAFAKTKSHRYVNDSFETLLEKVIGFPIGKLTSGGTIAMRHKETGIMKTGFYGFSWTTFFFWLFPALFRGDFITFIGGCVIGAVICLVTFGIGGLFLGPIWAFRYNKYYTLKLVERGYVLAGSDRDNATAASALGIAIK